MHDVSTTMVRCFAARAQSVGAAREATAEFAVDAGAGAEQADSIRLLVSEAVTNAIIHGYRGAPGEVRVSAAVCDGQLSIQVCDAGVGMHRRPVRPGLGLGLGLIARLSDEMAVVDRPAGGTEVQMRLRLTAGEPIPAPARAIAQPGERAAA